MTEWKNPLNLRDKLMQMFCMTVLEQIKKPLMEDIKCYEAFMKQSFYNVDKNINDILMYIISNRGKGLRPILTLLMANIHSDGHIPDDRAYQAAMLVEMVHTASLIHDDVVDNSMMRHGKKSLLGMYGAHISIVIGDLLLATAFVASMRNGNNDINTYIVDAVNRFCEGELLQEEQSKTLEMNRGKYYDIICKKTASLFGISAGVGAMAVRVSDKQVNEAWNVGYNLGMAFQIKDDILDFAPQSQTGKPSCGDLREHKITLPLLTVLENSSESVREEILSLVRSVNDGSNDGNVELLSRIVVERGGIEESERIMNGFIDKAHSIVDTFPASEYKESLSLFCDFIGGRNM